MSIAFVCAMENHGAISCPHDANPWRNHGAFMSHRRSEMAGEGPGCDLRHDMALKGQCHGDGRTHQSGAGADPMEHSMAQFMAQSVMAQSKHPTPTLATLRPVLPALYDRPVPDRLRDVPSDGGDGPGCPGVSTHAPDSPANATRAACGAGDGVGWHVGSGPDVSGGGGVFLMMAFALSGCDAPPCPASRLDEAAAAYRHCLELKQHGDGGYSCGSRAYQTFCEGKRP